MLAATGLAAAPWTLAACATAAQAPVAVVGRHLAFGADPQRQMAFAGELTAPPAGPWSSTWAATAASAPRCRWRCAGWCPRCRRTTARSAAASSSSSTPSPTASRPGERYRYRFRLPDGTTTPEADFVTAPGPGATAPWSFTAFADQGVDTVPPSGQDGFTNDYYDSDDTRRTMTPSTSMVDRIARQRPAFHLLAGDICYADPSGEGHPVRSAGPARRAASTASTRPCGRRTSGSIERSAASTPWMFATGNHDMEALYDDNRAGGASHGYGGHAARLDLPRTGPSACPSVYTFRLRQRRRDQPGRQRPLHRDPHQRGLLGRRADVVAAADAGRDARRPGRRLDRRVLPPLRLRDVEVARLRRRGARRGGAAVRRVLGRPRPAGPQPPVRAHEPDPARALGRAGPRRRDRAPGDRRHDLRVRRAPAGGPATAGSTA